MGTKEARLGWVDLPARYILLSTGGSSKPFKGFPSNILPPASRRTAHPAHTSHASHPPPQLISTDPAATVQRFKAAPPKVLRSCTIPPSFAMRFLKVSTTVSQLMPSLSLPHSTSTKLSLKPPSGGAGDVKGRRCLPRKSSKYAPRPIAAV